MKPLLLFLLLIITTPLAAQQQRKLDSLKNILAKLPTEGKSFGSDTVRVRVLCEMGEYQPTGGENDAILLSNDIITLSKKNNDQKGIAKGEQLIGYFYASKNEYMRAVEHIFRSLLVSEKLNDYKLTAKNYQLLGDCYSGLSSFEKARGYLKKSVELYYKHGLFKDYLISLNNLGLTYYEAKEYSTAIDYFNQCIDSNKKLGYWQKNIHFFTNIGLAYSKNKNYQYALQYLDKSKKLQESLLNPSAYQQLITLVFIAETWDKLNNTNKALTYLKQAAVLNLTSGTEVSSQMLYELYYKIYKRLNNNNLSLFYYEKYIQAKEKSSEQDLKKQISNLQFEYENEKQKVDIQLLNKDNERKNLVQKALGIGLFLILLFGGIQFWNNNILKNKNSQIEYQRSEISELNQGLEKKVFERTKELSQANEELLRKNNEILIALVEGQTIERKRVAIELHDNLGSMLSGMKFRLQALNKENLTAKEQIIYEGIITMMSNAYSEVRLISHNLLPAELEKKGLIGALQKLCDDINQSEKLLISVKTNNKKLNLDKKAELEIYSICLELVNNILKHSEATKAEIYFKKNTGNLAIEITDNGKGMSSDMKENGMGLKNIKVRLESLNGNFEIASTVDKGTNFILKIPMMV